MIITEYNICIGLADECDLSIVTMVFWTGTVNIYGYAPIWALCNYHIQGMIKPNNAMQILEPC